MEEYFIDLSNYESHLGNIDYSRYDIVGLTKNYRCADKIKNSDFLEGIKDGRFSFNEKHYCSPTPYNSRWIFCLRPDVHNLIIDSGFNYEITDVKFDPFGIVIETSGDAMIMLKMAS